MTACEPAHLLETLNRHERRQRFPLTFDDEFVVPERDAIQHVPDSLTDVERRDLVSHASPATSIVASVVGRAADETLLAYSRKSFRHTYLMAGRLGRVSQLPRHFVAR